MESNQKFPAGVAKKLLALMGKVGHVEKTGHNQQQAYTYVEEAVVVMEVRAAMIQVGLILVPSMIEKSMTPITSKGGQPGFISHVTMRYQLVDTDTGEFIEFSMPGDGMDFGDKGIYKAITGAHKYALLKCVQLSSGDDPEREIHQGENLMVPQNAAPPEPQTLDLGLMPFGKHKGKRLADVPTDYLGWLLGDLKEKQKRPELQEALITELEARAMVPEHVTTKGDVNLFEYAKQAILNGKTKGVAIATRAQYRTDQRLNVDQQVALDDAFNAKWAPPIEAVAEEDLT